MSVLDPTSGVIWPDSIRHLFSIYLNISDGHTEAGNILEEAEVKQSTVFWRLIVVASVILPSKGVRKVYLVSF